MGIKVDTIDNPLFGVQWPIHRCRGSRAVSELRTGTCGEGDWGCHGIFLYNNISLFGVRINLRINLQVQGWNSFQITLSAHVTVIILSETGIDNLRWERQNWENKKKWREIIINQVYTIWLCSLVIQVSLLKSSRFICQTKMSASLISRYLRLFFEMHFIKD